MNQLADLAGRLWQRLANEPAVLIAVVLVALRAMGADVDADTVTQVAETIEGNVDALMGLVAVRQTVDGPVTRRRKDRERDQDRQAVDELVHPHLDAAEDSHAD